MGEEGDDENSLKEEANPTQHAEYLQHRAVGGAIGGASKKEEVGELEGGVAESAEHLRWGCKLRWRLPE